ncbi:MAG: PhnD/SsuA/transferrin family substrate-binding protein, partial [Rubrivivax sp.]
MLRDDRHAPGFGAERHRRPAGAQGPWPPGRRVPFGDKGSTSGDRIPFHPFRKRGIDLDKRFARVLDTRHQAIPLQVTAGRRDACADFHRNRDVMLGQGLISAARSKVIWPW